MQNIGSAMIGASIAMAFGTNPGGAFLMGVGGMILIVASAVMRHDRRKQP